MAEPDDPSEPEATPQPEPAAAPPAWGRADFDDEVIGFYSPESLEGRPLAAPEPEPEPEVVPTEPETPLAAVHDPPRATRAFARPAARPEEGVSAAPDTRMATLIYGCLIASVVTLGLTILPALYLAWTTRAGGTDRTRGHRLYQLRTSIIGALAGTVGVLTLPVGLGVFILTATVVWVVLRGGAGLIRLIARKPVNDPRTWSLA